MKDKSYMPIKEFSRLTGIKRENLRYYDQIGLLSPECRGENGYRYYTQRQLSTAYLILSLREIGIGIEDIKEYIDRRNPENMFSLFKAQKEHIVNEIQKLQTTIEIMQLYIDMAENALKYEENSINIEYKNKEAIFLGPIISTDYNDESPSDSVISFCDFAAENGINLGYPLGTIICKENIESEEPLSALQHYFKTESEHNSYKPEGKYVVLYGRCAYGESDSLYRKLLAFIKENNLRIYGHAYEEYPLNELSIKNEEEYCVKIEIMVEDI